MQEEKITLFLHRKNGIKKVKIRPTQKLKKMMDFYSNETLIPLEKLYFFYNGRELSASDTPEAMNISNNDQIEVKIDTKNVFETPTEPSQSDNQTDTTESVTFTETSNRPEQMEQQLCDVASETSINTMEQTQTLDDAIASTSTEKRKNENDDSDSPPTKVRKTYPMSPTKQNLAIIAKYENVNWLECFRDILKDDSSSVLLNNEEYQRKLEMENEELKTAIEMLKSNHKKEVQQLKESYEIESVLNLDEVKVRTDKIITNLQERCDTYENDKKELEREIDHLKKSSKEGEDNFTELKIENNQLTSQLQAAVYHTIPNQSREIENLRNEYNQRVKEYCCEVARLTQIVNTQRKEKELTQQLEQNKIKYMDSLKIQEEQTHIISRLRSENEIWKSRTNNLKEENGQLKTELGLIQSKYRQDKENMNGLVEDMRESVVDRIMGPYKRELETTDFLNQANDEVTMAEKTDNKGRKCVQCQNSQPSQKLTLLYCGNNCKLRYFKDQYDKGQQ
ncbi:uncharacterized protein PFB0765w-like [Contarinia nasturtii]|uniref:uncharacterized protein PFB0765w-like n=1 Tax=Contarinia nasturtii TaxID=265458 RepID=UPI0012D4747B|nr:uncharacterized protein PFB0765w-like [Contarinia nasturtii]